MYTYIGWYISYCDLQTSNASNIQYTRDRWKQGVGPDYFNLENYTYIPGTAVSIVYTSCRFIPVRRGQFRRSIDRCWYTNRIRNGAYITSSTGDIVDNARELWSDSQKNVSENTLKRERKREIDNIITGHIFVGIMVSLWVRRHGGSPSYKTRPRYYVHTPRATSG